MQKSQVIAKLNQLIEDNGKRMAVAVPGSPEAMKHYDRIRGYQIARSLVEKIDRLD